MTANGLPANVGMSSGACCPSPSIASVHEKSALDRTGPTGVESVTFAVRLVMTYDLGSSLCSQGGGGIIRAVVHDYYIRKQAAHALHHRSNRNCFIQTRDHHRAFRRPVHIVLKLGYNRPVSRDIQFCKSKRAWGVSPIGAFIVCAFWPGSLNLPRDLRLVDADRGSA